MCNIKGNLIVLFLDVNEEVSNGIIINERIFLCGKRW